jgi:hypothetical protein
MKNKVLIIVENLPVPFDGGFGKRRLPYIETVRGDGVVPAG